MQGALPLALLGGLRVVGRRREIGWAWLAVAFAVSTLADLAQFILPPDQRWPVSIAYPVSQAGLMAAVLLPRREALVVGGILMASGLAACLWRGVEGPDVLLRSVAFLTIAGVAFSRWDLPLWLRPALLTYYALGWVCWLVHAHYLVLPTWFVNQGVRAVGLGLVCLAIWKASPTLKLVR